MQALEGGKSELQNTVVCVCVCLLKRSRLSQVWWCTVLTPEVGKQKLVSLCGESAASLLPIVSFGAAKAT